MSTPLANPSGTTIPSQDEAKREPQPNTAPKKKLINLLRGWPTPHLLPTSHLLAATQRVLTNPSISTPALQYAPDPGMRAVAEDQGAWIWGVGEGFLEEEAKWEEDEVEQRERAKAGKGVYKDVGPHRKLYRHVVYLVATCANPSGKTMTLSRREGLIHLARKYDALIISDDVYDFLQWPVSSTLNPSKASPYPLLPS
ncbi:Valine--pyruvate aminotransferase [Collariella sp. IMI 366227]|nr:Valine--pyruvate aminotransferase [Collariella sp. IMI 366227]